MKATKSLADLLTFWLIVVFVGFSPLTALASSDTNTVTEDTTWSVVEIEPNQFKWDSTSANEVYVNNHMVSSTKVVKDATLTIVAPAHTSMPYNFQGISGGGSVCFISQGTGCGFVFKGTDVSGAAQQDGTAVSVSSLTAEDCQLYIEGGKGGDGGTGGTGVTGALTAGKGSIVTVTGGEGGKSDGAKSGNGGTGVTGALTVSEGSVVTVTGGKGGPGGIGAPGDGGTGVTGEVTLAGGELTVKGGEPGVGGGGTSGQAFGDDATVTIAEGFGYTDGEEVYPAGKYTKSTDLSIDAFAEKTLKPCEAKIGNNFYITLKDAFTSAKDGATITLVRDVELEKKIVLSHAKSLSLDLNGRKMLFNFNDTYVRPFDYDDKDLITIKGSGTIEAKGLNASRNATIPLWRFVHDAAGTGTLTFLDDAAMERIGNVGDRPWAAFKDSITAAVLNEGVTKVGDLVFRYCMNLETVTLPATVTSINEDSSGLLPFDDCPKLKEIIVADGNTEYSNNNGDGVLYTKDKTKLIYCPRGKTGTLTVPAEVTTLAKYAFNNESDCVMSLSRIEFARKTAGTITAAWPFDSYEGECVLASAEGMLIDNERQVPAKTYTSGNCQLLFRAVTPWDSLQEQLNEGGTVKLTRSYDYTKDSYEINSWSITSHYGKLIVPKGTALDLNGYTLAAVEFYGDGEFTVKGGTLNCTRLTNNATMGDPTNATYGTLTLDDATVTADQLVWFGGMALMESTLTVGESEEGAGNNGKIINVTWVQPKSGAMLTMDTASSVTLPQQQETDGQWRLTDFQTSDDVAAAAGQLGAYLPRGWTFETITGTRVYGMSEQPYYALAVKDTAGAYPTSVTLRLISDSVSAAVTANNRTYDGTKQPLVTVDNTNLVGGVMVYAVTDEDTAPTDDNAYGESIPEATNAGTYYVWYRVKGDDTHSDSTPACATVTIGKAAARITKEPELKDTALKCTGSEQELIIPGEAEGGEIRYCVRLEEDATKENDPPEAEFTTSIPKATETANGWWNNIWYRVVGDNNHDDGPIIALGSVMMCPGTLSLNLAMEDWYVGEPASTPSLTGNLGGGKVVYSYKPVGADDSAYSETVPTEAGSYLIWAKVEETKNFGAGETIAAFLILEKQDPQENPQEQVTVHTETEFRQTVPDSPVLGIEDTNGLMKDTLKGIALCDTTPVGEGEAKTVDVRMNVKSTSWLDISPQLFRIVREYAATCSPLMRYPSQKEDFIIISLDKEVTIVSNEASMKGEMLAKSELPKGASIRTFTEQLTHLDTVLEIPLRYDMTGKYGPVILRIHDNEVLPLTRLESPEAVPADGTFYVEGSGAETVVHLYTKLCTLFAIVTGTEEAEPVKPESSPEATLVASLKAAGTDKMKLSWTRVKGANYYDVYFGKEGSEPVLLESVGGKRKSLTIKNLEKGTTYVAYVQPWKQAGGEKTLLGNPSPVVYAVTNGSATEVNAKGVYVNSKRMTMMAGTEYTLNGYVKGGAKGKKLVERVAPLRFYSDNINVAEVAPDGTITAVGEGKCLIYTLSNNGMYKATKVMVIDGPTKIRFSKKSISMQAGSQKDITSLIKTSPNNITTPYTLTTDSETVATVDSNGIVTAVGPGRAVITVTTSNNKTAKLTIRVKGGSAVSKGMEAEPTLEIITEDAPEEEFPTEESAPSIEPEAGETTLDLESLTE